MTERTNPSGDSLLQRWSRLKTEAREKDKAQAPMRAPAAPALTAVGPTTATAPEAEPPASPASQGAAAADAQALPPVESLTIDSDFAPFLKPKVDEALKRRALKQLFRDPHFNVMDGLDTYIGDYTQPDPIPPEIVREMVQGRYIFNPPPTRINAQGYVEDVPPEELAALERDGEAATRDSSADGPVAAAPLPPPETEGMMPAQLSLPEVGAPTNSELSPEPAPAAAPNTRDSPSATTAAPGETNKAAR